MCKQLCGPVTEPESGAAKNLRVYADRRPAGPLEQTLLRLFDTLPTAEQDELVARARTADTDHRRRADPTA